jgi:hypothetical protein
MPAPGIIYKTTTGVFGAIPLTSLLEVKVQKGASKSRTRADGSLAYNMIYGEAFTRTVTVTMQQNGNYMALQPAMIGKLSFPIVQQAAGSGDVGGGNATLNIPAAASTGSAYLESISEGFSNEGNPTINLTFDVYDGNGDQTLLEEIIT